MIRKYRTEDLDVISKLWLKTNLEAHHFINPSYWHNNFNVIQEMLEDAEIYVYEKDNRIYGFFGLVDTYIAGIFVDQNTQSQGVGKSLLTHVKNIKNELTLSVYKKNTRAVSFYKHQGFTISKEELDEEHNEVELTMKWTQ